MTTPDVPLRLEFSVEVPGTPEQVWSAIATASGISSWFLPTDLEEREGGAIVTHMGDEGESPGTVTGWDPPRRFAYEEPDWAGLVGRPGAPVTPLATEFLVEAQSGGTCVVRVVSSAFGTGAEWEREFFAGMEQGWLPHFQHLRLYLTHFPGQRATVLEASATLPGKGPEVLAAMRGDLGVEEAGQPVDARGLAGTVDHIGDLGALVHLSAPAPGYFSLYAVDAGDGTSMAGVRGYLFSDDAPDLVAKMQPAWQAWVDSIGRTAG